MPSILGKAPDQSYFPPMARDAVIDEIKTAPESVVRETYDFIPFLKQRRALVKETAEPQILTAKPD